MWACGGGPDRLLRGITSVLASAQTTEMRSEAGLCHRGLGSPSCWLHMDTTSAVTSRQGAGVGAALMRLAARQAKHCVFVCLCIAEDPRTPLLVMSRAGMYLWSSCSCQRVGLCVPGGPSHAPVGLVPPSRLLATAAGGRDGTTTLVSALPTHRTSYRVSPHPTTGCGQAAIAIAILMINRPMMLRLFPPMSPRSRCTSLLAPHKGLPNLAIIRVRKAAL